MNGRERMDRVEESGGKKKGREEKGRWC